MRPSFLDNMSWAMAEVYGSVTDRLLVNLARHFPYIKNADQIRGSFDYQARLLAQMGQVNRESVDIIMQSLGGADAALRSSLEAAILEALKGEEPKLRKAAQQGLLNGSGMLPAEVTPNQMQAFQAYYRQSADNLNLVNTVMLESTQAAYQATVADVAARIARSRSILNVGAGEVLTGVSAWNTAMREAVDKMVQNGLTGFVDHAGRKWTPEAYVAMDIRTTMFNTAREAISERAQEFGCDLYQVSSHNGARPLCYPWQGKVISRTGWTGTVKDLYGDDVTVHSEDEIESFRWGGGLFGVNCRHYPMNFIPGFSTLKGEPQDPEENEQAYAESQQQRALERKLRGERRDLAILKAQGAPEEEIRAQRAKVSKASSDIDAFCDETGRARRRAREYTPVNATWPGEVGVNVERFRDDYIPQVGGTVKSMQNETVDIPVNVPAYEEEYLHEPAAGVGNTMQNGNVLERQLGDAYEYHRTKHGLNSVEYDPDAENGFITVDFAGMDKETAKTAEETLSGLARKYDTTLTSVRTASPNELGDAHAVAVVNHNVISSSSEMLLNKNKFASQAALHDMAEYNIEKGFWPNIPEELADKYVYMHEFGHTLIDTQTRIDKAFNPIGVDYGRITKIRKEITSIYKEYARKVGELEKLQFDLGQKFEESFDLESYERGKQVARELKQTKLSEYSLTNADEFFAEAFAYTELGGTGNSYADRVRTIIDIYFRR